MKRKIPGPAGALDQDRSSQSQSTFGQQPDNNNNTSAPTGVHGSIPSWPSILKLVFGTSSHGKILLHDNFKDTFLHKFNSFSHFNFKSNIVVHKSLYIIEPTGTDLQTQLATIEQIHDGLHDLTVPHLVVVVTSVTHNIDGSILLQLEVSCCQQHGA
jgi:hypothetical protein